MTHEQAETIIECLRHIDGATVPVLWALMGVVVLLAIICILMVRR